MANNQTTRTVKKTNAAPEAPAKKDAVVKANPQALATQGAFDMESLAGAGSENVTAADLAIPRLSILQSGSPQVKKSEGAYLKGAEEGDFYDNVQNIVLAKSDEGFLMVPVKADRHLIEWIKKNQGGGLVAIHPATSDILSRTTKDDFGADVLANGHEIVNTGELYCVVAELDGSSPRAAVISFAKTQFKKYKNLNTQLNMLRFPSPSKPGATYNPPYFASTFKVTSVPESNDKGNWMGWNLERDGNTADQSNAAELLQLALGLYESLKSGNVRVADPVADGSGTSTNSNEAF